MNFKLNALVAAALLVAAGSANAAISDNLSGNGELFLAVSDVVAGYSFVGDLGIAMDSFSGATGQSFNLSSFSQWTPFLAAVGGNLSNANFAVLAFDSTGTTAGSDRMMLSTSSTVALADLEATQSKVLGAAASAPNTWFGKVNTSTDVAGGDMESVANGSAYSSVANTSTYFDTAVGGSILNKLPYSVYTSASEAAKFGYMVTGGTQSTLTPVVYTALGDFAINGNSLNYTVAAVPEAETYAMLLAGLGLVGFMVSRRRSAA